MSSLIIPFHNSAIDVPQISSLLPFPPTLIFPSPLRRLLCSVGEIVHNSGLAAIALFSQSLIHLIFNLRELDSG
ncbi:hypothetical protein MKX03_001252 [Papaver bracteatum]|nr:hypothetical protein MKX03_001252 [Papaver bracteatum]